MPTTRSLRLMTNFLLNCFVLGDDDKVFTVEIARDKNISILKKLIKEENARLLAQFDAKDLDLFQVSLTVDRITSELKVEDVEGNRKLHPVNKIFSIFREALEDEHVHILVRRPTDIQVPTSSPVMPLLPLRCHLLGDKRNTFITIEIEQNKDISILKKLIKMDKSVKLAKFDASDLVLHNVSLPLADFDTQFDTLELDSYPILSDANKLSSIFDNSSESLVHIVVIVPPEDISPSLRRVLHSIYEENRFIFQREEVAAAASKRDPPSTGAKNSTLRKTQKEIEIDAIYNGRPVNLTAPPIEIYHPIFAKFRRELSRPIDKSSFTANELTMAMELVTNSLAFYKDEDARINEITTALNVLVDEQVLRRTEITRDNGNYYTPDGSVFVHCEKFPRYDKAASTFSEVKNGVGEGKSDPIQQAQCDYVPYYSAGDRHPHPLSFPYQPPSSSLAHSLP